MRHWTPEERRKQAELIRNWQPWETGGVKSPGGKMAVRHNALKSGTRTIEVKVLRSLLAESRKLLKEFGCLK